MSSEWSFNYRSVIELETKLVKFRVVSIAQVKSKAKKWEWMGITMSDIKRVCVKVKIRRYNKVKAKDSLWECILSQEESFLIPDFRFLLFVLWPQGDVATSLKTSSTLTVDESPICLQKGGTYIWTNILFRSQARLKLEMVWHCCQPIVETQ